MGLIKEPQGVDFSTQSEPWTPEELADFRNLMTNLKARNAGKQPVTLFPEKLRKANAILDKTGIPKLKKRDS
jgi:hypothetical protein